MKKIKLITNAVYWLAIVLLVAIALGTAFTVIEAPGGYRLFVVQSGSMEPKIKTGSIVLVAPQKEYKKGEIITFLANPKLGLKDIKNTITHRIVKVNNDEGRISFNTKGDANKTADRELVAKKQVLGRVLFSLPYAGYAVAFTRTKTGFIALIIIPGTLIIYSELLNIKKEIWKMFSAWREKSKNKKDKNEKETKKTFKKKKK